MRVFIESFMSSINFSLVRPQGHIIKLIVDSQTTPLIFKQDRKLLNMSICDTNNSAPKTNQFCVSTM